MTKPIPSTNIFPVTVKTMSSGIAMLSYDKMDKNILRDVTYLEELVSILLEQNNDHHRQATLNGTTFTTAPLKKICRLYGTSNAADNILAGKFDLSSLGVSDGVMTWLEELAYNDD